MVDQHLFMRFYLDPSIVRSANAVRWILRRPLPLFLPEVNGGSGSEGVSILSQIMLLAE
jgi:hypothetical protein